MDGRRHLCCVHHHYNGQPRPSVHAETPATAGRSGRLVDGENAFHVVCGGADPVSRVDVYSGSDECSHARVLRLIAMYLQARNASETEMDKRLGVASHRNKDDVAK